MKSQHNSYAIGYTVEAQTDQQVLQSNRYASAAEGFVVSPYIRRDRVQPVWDRGIFTGGSNGSVQVPGRNPVPIL